MSPRRFLATLAVALVLIGVANAAIVWLARGFPARRLIATLRSDAPADVLALGNSTFVAGFKPALFEQAWQDSGGSPVRAINAAIGGTRPAIHLLLAQEALEHRQAPSLLIYGVFDFMLFEETPKNWTRLIGNNALAYYTQPATATRHFTENHLDALVFHSFRCVPMLVERANLWKQVELLRRDLGGIGLPSTDSNQFGRVDDFVQLSIQDAGEFERLATQITGETQPLSQPVTELVALARSRGIRAVIVQLPLPGKHREFYRTEAWQHYLTHARALLASEGAELVDATGWVTDDADFVDTVHLRTSGATIFSQRLAQVLSGETMQVTTAP